MYLYQYALLAGFACLLFYKDTRSASVAFLLGWAVYFTVVLGANEVNYYALSGAIELSIAYYLNSRFRLVSYLGYSLLVLNFIGFLCHESTTNESYYDAIYAVIAIAQFLILQLRVFADGISRLSSEHFVVRAVNFDSRGAYGRMYKNTQTQGKNP